MKIALLACAVFFVSGFFSLAYAQSDSESAVDSTYDLGRTTFKKRNVQAITIKGSDLEKMPFTDIKDAINIYVNGIYSAKQNYAYVIDGILNADINAYSIYDIDEISIIQNAATALNGADPTKVLVLVKTRRGGTESSGVTVAGQSDFVRLMKISQFLPNPEFSANDLHKVNTMYHQYYVSAYANTKNIRAGISAEIIHNDIPLGADIVPVDFNYEQYGAINTNRYKFNGYLDVKLGERNLLSVNTGYAPQRDLTNEYNTVTIPNGHINKYDANFYSSQNLFYTDIKLTTQIAQGFTNKISAGFQRLRSNAQEVTHTYDNGTLANSFERDSVSAINSYVAKDDISYETQLGDFTLQPNVNFTYRQAGNPHSMNEINSYNGQFFPPLINQYSATQKLAILTPSITLGYLDWVSLQGGFQTYFNSTAKSTVEGHDNTTPLPFATANIDLTKPLDLDTNDMHLNLFGSYAQNFTYANDLTSGLLDNYFIHVGNNANFSTAPDPYQVYTQIQGGLTASFLGNKLSFSYNYSLKRFSAGQDILTTDVLYIDHYSNTNARVELHRVGIDFALPTDGNFKWRTNLNGTLVIMRDSYKVVNYLPEFLRLAYPGKPFITGGFVNQFSYKDLYLDFGVIYCMNQAKLDHPNSTQTYELIGKTNTFDLQNIDLGYKIPVTHIKSLEVYASARNLFQNDQSAIVESRRFIGAGFKVGL
ncbi:hypothetical protein [Mucilaginibacter sp. dw_454]|uniref:hypothetical protein n=1 Tax=Mucilaginibacter sp. dw_454 TaxID=2720079 RepID=UPI001BD4CA82|nr:hypothetical protein [Mucilaginibacter sp. dw_454]